MTNTMRTVVLLCVACLIAGVAEPVAVSAAPESGQLDVRRQDYGKFIPNQSVLKTPLRIGTKDMRRGLGSHSHSEFVVRLPAPGQRFEAQVGVDHNRDTTGGRGSVKFVVEVGGKEVLKSATLRGGDEPVRIGVDLDGARQFTLRATDAGDGPFADHADLYPIFPRPDGKHWDGIEYYDPEAKKGVVYIFKPAAQPDTMTVRLRGVRADARYHVTFEDGSNPSVDKRGNELTTGMEVTLRGERVSELMFFEEIAEPTAVE